MTKREFTRWRSLAVRLASIERGPAAEFIRKGVAEFFAAPDTPFTDDVIAAIQGYDESAASDGDRHLVCDLVSEWVETSVSDDPTWPIGWDDMTADQQDAAWETWRFDGNGGAIDFCIRAAIDVCWQDGHADFGVMGFTVGQVRRACRYRVPTWLDAVYKKPLAKMKATDFLPM